jgi:hypothetical protein
MLPCMPSRALRRACRHFSQLSAALWQSPPAWISACMTCVPCSMATLAAAQLCMCWPLLLAAMQAACGVHACLCVAVLHCVLAACWTFCQLDKLPTAFDCVACGYVPAGCYCCLA